MGHHYNLGLKFIDVVRAHGARTVIETTSGESSTYTDLNALSNRVAHLFVDCGFKRGDVAAIFHDKSPLGFAVMIACLKLGIVYANLDAESPWERLRKILQTARPRGLINLFSEVPHSGEVAETTDVINVRGAEISHALPTFSSEEPAKMREVTGADPAYIMFTSGSTGFPKGAVMSHANVLNFISWARECFQIIPDDIFTGANPICFDNSVFDFYVSLFSGAKLVPVRADEMRDGRRLVSIVNERRCSIWFSVPSLLVYLLTTRVLKGGDFPTIRKIIFGGEGFPKRKLKQLFDMFADRADLENVYGPTECTCICSSHRIENDDFTDMKSLATLGHLAPNFDYEILATDNSDPNFGELFLRGPNVGLGYYNDAQRTAKSFIQNPMHRRHVDIGYRTGDLVRRDNSGRLYFKGRSDFQIKHMGYRIELEEIEAALGTIGCVNECAVIYQKLGDGLGQIAGFVSVDSASSADELLQRVSEIVPSYMVPKKMVILDSLPKGANGKIDKIALEESLMSRI